MSEERLWILGRSYTDVVSFTMLRSRVMEVVRATPGLCDRPLRFIVVDDTGGYDDEIKQLCVFDDIRVVTPPFNLGHQARHCVRPANRIA